MHYRVNFDGYASTGSPMFLVTDGAADPARVFVGLPPDRDITEIRSRTPAFANDGFRNALTAYAVRKIESVLRIDGPDAVAGFRAGVRLDIELSEIEMLAERADAKECVYQHRDQRELFCAASYDEDPAGPVRVGLRWLAPTTATVCEHCDLPNADLICSHLSHPSVGGANDGDFYQRLPLHARCERRQPNVSNGVRCRPGGHACWVRTVPAPESRPSDLDRSPIAFSEALHFLNVVWTMKFGKARALVQSRDGTAHARIAQGARDRDEFRARLSDLADVLKTISIANDMLPSGNENSGPLIRIRLSLESKLVDATDQGRLARAVKTLQSVNDLRTEGQHSGAAETLKSGLAGLCVRYPPDDWAELWGQVRAIAAGALTEIRRLVEQVPESP
jgi:hypothetical protein